MRGTRPCTTGSARREAIEAEFGGKLDWHRLDDNITSKIAITVPGGWADESTFNTTVATAVDDDEALLRRARHACEGGEERDRVAVLAIPGPGLFRSSPVDALKWVIDLSASPLPHRLNSRSMAQALYFGVE